MLINALCDYYDIKKEIGDMIPEGFSKQPIHYRISLTSDGEISNITDIRKQKETKDKNGKAKITYVPKEMIFPERQKTTSICSFKIDHRPTYIFGLNYDKDGFRPDDKTEKAKKSHQSFIKENLDYTEEMASEIVMAYRNFIQKWKPEEQTQNPHLLALGKDYSSSSFCFALDGYPDVILQKSDEICSKRTQSGNVESKVDDSIKSMCAITGEIKTISRIHDNIKRISGGISTGSVLVGVKNSAGESYGKTQSYNSNISEEAMKKYTNALNSLTGNENHRIYLGGLTIVFWAMSPNEENECSFFRGSITDVGEVNNSLSAIMKNVKQGKKSNLENFEMDEDVVFYIVGLSPNSSRICQKLIYRNKFGRIIENVCIHQLDMSLEETKGNVSVGNILKELLSPKSKNEEVPKPLVSALFMSILQGSKYPLALLETVIRRVKTDSDEEKKPFIKINYVRAGIIKACLNRNARIYGKKEEIKMALNTENTNQAYLCGRLFAVLEKIQKDSAKGDLNKTIKDAFFASACSNPATVFPKLTKLSQNHLAKLEPGEAVFYNRKVGEIIDMLKNSFPSTLTLQEQGNFIIGYYQQNQDNYKSKNGKDN